MYDLREIKSISCGNVAQKYGIKLKRKDNRLWGKLREEEKTASFSINLENNLWYDFGAGKGGSVIDLVSEIEGISSTEAINKLAEEYGFKSEKTNGWKPLTDRQYREIGIQPERATMNFGFDLNKQTVEQLSRWSSKYGVSVSNLAEKYPKVYNKMINKISIGQINVLRDAYNARMNIINDPSTNKKTKEFLKYVAKADAEELKQKIELIKRAIKPLYEGQRINLSHLMVYPKKDFEKQNSQISSPLSDEQEERAHIIKVYKKLFNFKQIDSFNIEQIKALQYINKAIVGVENKYIPINDIKSTYTKLGKNLESLESEYCKLLDDGENLNDSSNPEFKQWNSKTKMIESELKKVKNLFAKCNTVIEGIKEANLTMKSDTSKNQAISTIKSFELSQ